MKKITWFMSCLLLLLVGLQARAADVYVETDDPTFNVYTWSPETYGGWPGKTLTDEAVGGTLVTVNGKDYYKFTIDAIDANGGIRYIIFNKGNQQTDNIRLVDGDNFFVYPAGENRDDYTKYETTNPPIAITSYTIVGVAELCGEEWAPGETSNDMLLQEDGSYQLVKEGLTLMAGTNYDYKVVGNHVWSLWEVPQQGNQTLTVTEDGEYDVTFTLTLGDTPTLTAEATKVGTVVIDHTYTVTGAEELMGVAWDVNAVENEMTLVEEGVYTLVKENIELNAATYDYKVVRDHSWSWAVPQSGNYSLNIAERGKYNVTFKLSLLTDPPTLTAEAEMLEEPPTPITVYTVVGQAGLMGVDWDVNAVENEMTQEAQGVYTLTKSEVVLTAGDYQYKVVGNHDYGAYQLPLNGDNTLNIPTDGKYNVTFKLTLGEDEDQLTAVAQKIEEPQPEPEYVLHYGLEGEQWQDKVFVAGEGEYAGKLIAKDVAFEADTQFGIKYGDIWYAGIPEVEGEPHYWIHAGWCANVPLNTGDGVKNFIINEEGTYSFVLTLGDEGITMDVLGFPQAGLLGDLDNDGVVGVSDMNIMINMILGKQEKTLDADLNNDQEVDVTDVGLEINIILGKNE